MELHSMANASSFFGDSSIFMNNNDKIKNPIKSKEEKLEHENINEIKIMIESVGEKLKEVSPLQSCYDIYHVPRQLYKLNPDAYTPHTVSLGPLHHNDDHLWIKETHKLQYLNRLLSRSGKTFEFCVEALSGLEEKAHKCYSDTMNLGKVEFAKILVMDSCFMLEFLESWRFKKNEHFASHDSWSNDILIDMMKLENQLPLFVLEHLDGLLFDRHRNFSFSHYIYESYIRYMEKALHDPIPYSAEELDSLLPANGGAKHFLDLFRCILIPSKEIPSNERHVQLAYNASELKSAGVKFQRKENASNLFAIDFNKKTGVLTIPTINISDETEVVLRNLVAFEQDKPYTIRYFTTYATFLDGLIDTAMDVTLLTQRGIIINNTGSPENVAALFNKLGKQVLIVPYYSNVVQDLNGYYNKSWNKWMANLRQTYFNSPWAGISVAAAVLVIILTMIQTICSLLQI